MWDAVVFIVVGLAGVGASELVRAHVARTIARPHPASRRVLELEVAQPNGLVPRPSAAES